MLGILVFILLISAYVLLIWALFTAAQSHSKEREKDSVFMTKTFWIFFTAAIVWALLALVRFQLGFPSWGYVLFAIVLAYEARAYHKAVKRIKAEHAEKEK